MNAKDCDLKRRKGDWKRGRRGGMWRSRIESGVGESQRKQNEENRNEERDEKKKSSSRF